MKLLTRSLALLIAVSFFVGCAFENSDIDPNRKRDLNNREKLLRAFQSIQGVYEGELTTPSRIEAIRLVLSFTEVVAGKTQDGEIRYQPELRAKFSRLSRDLFDSYLTASYIEELSDLTLTTQENGGEYFYIRGKIQNDSYSAPALNRDGSVVGHLTLKLVTRDVLAPVDGQYNETYDRIKARLERITGEYVLHMKPVSRNHESFRVTMLVRLEDAQINGMILPTLAAYSRREDGFSEIARHGINYDGGRIPEKLTFIPATGAKGYSNWTMTAYFENGEFKGTAAYPVYSADVVAKRVSAPDSGRPADPKPEEPKPAPKPSPKPPKKPGKGR